MECNLLQHPEYDNRDHRENQQYHDATDELPALVVGIDAIPAFIGFIIIRGVNIIQQESVVFLGHDCTPVADQLRAHEYMYLMKENELSLRLCLR